MLCTLLSISSTYAGPNDKTEKKKCLNISRSNNSHLSQFIENGVTEVEIIANCYNNATITVDIPLSVKKVTLTGRISNNSHIYLYMRHTPRIDTDNISQDNNATILPMHPIRKYTYHLAAFAAVGALAYYFTREK